VTDAALPAQVHVVQNSDVHVQSPEALGTHPGARETDPFFTTTKNMSQDQIDEQRNPTRSFGASMDRSLSPTSTWQPDLNSATSAHPMSTRPASRGSASVSVGGRSLSRRDSNQSQRKVPTRTDSGREFWGLPDPPRRHQMTFPEDVQEDSSEDEEEEWVSLQVDS
jgi:hypothetical protein